MAPKSEYLAGPLDMRRLLDLLNSSEGNGYESNEPVPSTEYALSNLEEPPPGVSSLNTTNSKSPTDPTETVENRFAAHIVHGMSKLRQS